MRKFAYGIMTLIGLSSSMAAFADANASSSSLNPSHFYVGLSGGLDVTQLDVNTTQTTATTPATVAYVNTKYSGQNFVGGVLAGYQWALPRNWLTAFELFAEGEPTTSHFSTGATPQSFAKRGTLGFSLLPGYQVTPNTSLYARMGLVRSRFNLEAGAGAFSGFPSGYNINRNCTGYQFGLGSAVNLSTRLSLRGEYDYIYYNKTNFSGSNGGSPSVVDDNAYRFTSNEFKLALVWAL